MTTPSAIGAPPGTGSLQAAGALLARGEAETAAAACRALLNSNPLDLDARHLHGRCLAALGHLGDAVSEFRSALALRADHLPALVDLGVAYALLGNHRDAHQVLQSARALDARPAEVHFALGLSELGLNELQAAEVSFRRAIARNARFAAAHNGLGVVLERRGQLSESITCFRKALAAHPELVDAHRNLGDGLLRLGRAREAVESYAQQVALAPHDATAHAALGAAQLAAGDFTAAARALEAALALDGSLAGSVANLGTALYALNRPEEAEAAWRRALALDPALAEARLGLGRLCAARGDPAGALREFTSARTLKPQDAAVALSAAGELDAAGAQNEAITLLTSSAQALPGDAAIQNALGELLHRIGRYAEAISCYERALAIDPDRAETHVNRGHALESLAAYPAAIESFERALSRRPAGAAAIAGVASCALRTCDWELARAAIGRLAQLPEGLESLHPFLMHTLDIGPAALVATARRRARARFTQPAGSVAPYNHDRLRLAYVSPDFREHAVAHCLAGVISRHDRGRFEVVGVSLSPADGSRVGARLAASFDDFVDASSMSDKQLAALLRAREIDIAVDLAGFTSGARPGIFADRAAPVQVSYLGFPGTSGADFIDFIVADPIVVPVEDEEFYSERVLRLPDAYLPFDADRPLPRADLRRGEVGLPAEAIVLCAFGNAYKITQAMFAVWLELLAAVPASVLWLRGLQPRTESRLRALAQQHGVRADRLVFAPFVESVEEHLARLALADLFLDTVPYNAHSTAAEALWAGVPVITCRGHNFAGRVGASLLSAAGLSELICSDLADYRRRSLELLDSPARLAELRARLAAARSSAPVFDTARYTRNLEAAFLTAWRRGS
jgi:predicted O-linked N-acetylglucosamine transferase (SPINDLY family)